MPRNHLFVAFIEKEGSQAGLDMQSVHVYLGLRKVSLFLIKVPSELSGSPWDSFWEPFGSPGLLFFSFRGEPTGFEVFGEI